MFKLPISYILAFQGKRNFKQFENIKESILVFKVVFEDPYEDYYLSVYSFGGERTKYSMHDSIFNTYVFPTFEQALTFSSNFFKCVLLVGFIPKGASYCKCEEDSSYFTSEFTGFNLFTKQNLGQEELAIRNEVMDKIFDFLHARIKSNLLIAV